MEASRRIFDRIACKNEVSWSSLIHRYVQNGDFNEAIWVFHKMEETHVMPNDATIICVITACANLGILDLARKFHLSLDEGKVQSGVVLSTALVDMYVKW